MHLLSLLVFTVSSLRWPALTVLLAVFTLSACDKVPLLAPTSSTINLTVNTTVVPVNGTAEVTASVTESAGTPVHNGTVVTFTSSFGTIEPAEARTNGGKATVRFIASTQSGTAQIGAFSGATRSETVEILVGGAAAERLVLRANPQTISATDGRSEIIATVLDAAGNPLRGVPVTFSAGTGQVSPGQAITDDNGEARTTFTGSRSGEITATAGSQTETVAITVASPGVAITPPETLEAGVAATFQIVPIEDGGAIRNVVINWGDNSAQTQLGPISGSTPVAHVFARAGIYTVRATVTDAQGVTGTSSIVVNVTDQSTIAVTLGATPNPVSLSNPQQGLVTFSATVGGGLGGGVTGIQSYTWDFGDGRGAFTTGAGTNTRYTAPGTYVASVSVRTVNGTTGYAQLTIRVNP